MSEKNQKPAERRKWGKRPGYPFVDSTGILVNENRRVRIDPRQQAPGESRIGSGNFDGAPESANTGARIELVFQKWHISLSPQEKRCSFGRDQNCDLVLLNRFASRRHGRVEWRNGRFYFCDHSFNGTYIDFNDGRSAHICRDEIILSGSGVLSLGKPTNVDTDFLIRFTIS